MGGCYGRKEVGVVAVSREERESDRASSPLCLRLLPGTSLSLPAFDPVFAMTDSVRPDADFSKRYLPIRITSSHLPLTPARISDPTPCLPSARSSACTPTARATASLSGASSMVCLRYVVGTATLGLVSHCAPTFSVCRLMLHRRDSVSPRRTSRFSSPDEGLVRATSLPLCVTSP